MANRATFLAKRIVSRLQSLDAPGSRRDGTDSPETLKLRKDTVAKVLTVEEGIVDEFTVQKVLTGLPAISGRADVSPREMAEFAEFLRVTLKL
jgi:hypothetical protein